MRTAGCIKSHAARCGESTVGRGLRAGTAEPTRGKGRNPVKKAKSSIAESQDAAVAAQNELLACGWPTSTEVGRANGSQFDNPAQWAKNKRDAGELLGVWSPAENTWRYPDFKFLPDRRLNPRVKELLNALALHPDFRRIWM